MTVESWAQLVVAAYVMAVGIAIWRYSGRCEHGRKVWGLYVLNRLLCGLLYRWRANRDCPFPHDGPAIIIANHRSPVDPMLLWMNHHRAGNKRRVRAINFLMAREFYEMPSLNWMYRALQSIPVNRDAKEATPVREAIRRLRKGELVGIFPEGRINTGDNLLPPAGTGVAYLALKSRVPVYPVFIHGSPQGADMVSSFLKPARVTLAYGDAIDLSEYYGSAKRRETLEEVTHLLMNQVAKLGGIKDVQSADDHNAPTIRLERAAE